MKLSIITVVYNGEAFIESAIDSVLSQAYKNLEYIVVDGQSTDGTLELLGKYKSRIDTVISEPDKGIYDAMNKGIKVATGEIVGILNSDDFYVQSDVLGRVAAAFEKNAVDSVYGNIRYVSKADPSKIVRSVIPGPRRSFTDGWYPPHPAFFVRRKVYENFGGFRVDMRVSADFELMLRFLEKNAISSHYINDFLVDMRTGGESNRLKGILEGYKQIKEAFQLNEIPYPRYYPWKRYSRKVKEFF